MDAQTHILVVDDDPDICEYLKEYLESNGYFVRAATDGAAMRRLLDDHPADLVILDLMMPGEDGLSLTRYLREHFELGIIILTGKDTEVDRVVGLEMGADDYISKPFGAREFLARVKTVLRRTAATQGANSAARYPVTKFGGWNFDRVERRLTDADGREVSLTTMEFNLLRAFTDHPNRVLDRDRLLDLLQNRNWEPYDRSIDVLVGRLRSKIEKNPKKPELIKTVRGTGYVLAATVERAERESHFAESA
jgi:DNA-binding response OmpR family regulator